MNTLAIHKLLGLYFHCLQHYWSPSHAPQLCSSSGTIHYPTDPLSSVILFKNLIKLTVRSLCCVLSSNITFFTSFLSVETYKGSGIIGMVAFSLHLCFRFIPLQGKEPGAASLAAKRAWESINSFTLPLSHPDLMGGHEMV